MKLIETKCDFCKIITKECEELQIGDKLFDLCSSCMSKINKLINGSGRPVIQISIPSQPGDWLSYPNFAPLNPSLQPFQITYGSSTVDWGGYNGTAYEAINSACSTVEV